MHITVYGPNLRGVRHTFHVHARGCAHGAQPVYAHAERVDLDVAARVDVARVFYAEMADESGVPVQAYLDQFKFAPCCKELPL